MSQITIRTMTLEGAVQAETIEAELVGPFAVHLAVGVELLDGSPAWSVTYVATGTRASPFYFPTADQGRTVGQCLAAIPVDWGKIRALSEDHQASARSAVYAISDLCGGFLIESALAAPAGSA